MVGKADGRAFSKPLQDYSKPYLQETYGTKTRLRRASPQGVAEKNWRTSRWPQNLFRPRPYKSASRIRERGAQEGPPIDSEISAGLARHRPGIVRQLTANVPAGNGSGTLPRRSATRCTFRQFEWSAGKPPGGSIASNEGRVKHCLGASGPRAKSGVARRPGSDQTNVRLRMAGQGG